MESAITDVTSSAGSIPWRRLRAQRNTIVRRSRTNRRF
jgi:hypothetical protein